MSKPDIQAVYDFFGLTITGRGTGSWTKAQCPMPDHEDNDPSASVNTDEGIFKCHACGERGDAYDIVKARENVTGWADLKRRTAEIAGGSDGPVQPGPSSSSLLSGRPRRERTDSHFVPAWRRL